MDYVKESISYKKSTVAGYSPTSDISEARSKAGAFRLKTLDNLVYEMPAVCH